MTNVTNSITDTIIKFLEDHQDVRNKLSGESPRTHKDIEAFQDAIAGTGYLNGNKKDNTEHPLFKSSKDSADIFFSPYPYPDGEYELIIEIDATRADQVAKKMLSRFCYSVSKDDNRPLIYVALLYKGTASMNSEECKKYFQMGASVLRKLNENSILMGYIIGKEASMDEVFVFQASNSIQYNEDLVYDRESYIQYLYDENIKSIDNYSAPLNKIETLTDNDKRIFFEGLKGKTKNGRYNCISNKFYNNHELNKDQKSYWNKYIQFLNSKK